MEPIPTRYFPSGVWEPRWARIERLNRGSAIKLFLSATNVRTCKVRIFTCREVTADAVLASACLPFMSQAVEIDGEAYWDGGYMGNPAIYPLIYHCETPDVLVVHINPMNRPDVPTSARDIMNHSTRSASTPRSCARCVRSLSSGA
jgi:NTE family protein